MCRKMTDPQNFCHLFKLDFPAMELVHTTLMIRSDVDPLLAIKLPLLNQSKSNILPGLVFGGQVMGEGRQVIRVG